MLIKVPSALNIGLKTMAVDCEINVANRGLPGFDIVGLASKAVDESKERVRTAIINSKIEFPARKITVNLAPADVPKEGSFYDLPIALGIIASVTSYPIPEKSLFFGELSLDGHLRHTKGALLLALFAKEAGYKHVFVPKESANEAAIVPEIKVYPVLEVTKIYSVSGNIPAEGSLMTIRPFRSPHHTISQVGLIGGGTNVQSGEISLAHRGVLFLDEFNEFPRSVLEALRQPIEDGIVSIVRSKARVSYPAKFMLVASANPCPCGYLNHPKKACVCTPREVAKYKKRTSGPILDRIDLYVEVPAVDIKELGQDKPKLETSEQIRKRVEKARNIQKKRFEDEKIFTNAEMKNEQIKKFCPLSKEVEKILYQAGLILQISARSYYKMIKIARTIADLDNCQSIGVPHMAEALQYALPPQTYEEV